MRLLGAEDGPRPGYPGRGSIAERKRKVDAVLAVMRREGFDNSARGPELAQSIVEAVDAVSRSGPDRRIADRRDSEAYRDLIGNPLWKADARANRMEYERRQGERRQGERRQ